MNLGQLKILQEVTALSVFVLFSIYYLNFLLNLTMSGLACVLHVPCSLYSENGYLYDKIIILVSKLRLCGAIKL